MNVHKNARLTPKGREILIARLLRGEHPSDVAAAMGVSIMSSVPPAGMLPESHQTDSI